MKLSNPERAVVDILKLRDYCLNPEHRRGCHKARVFASSLGLTAADANYLREALLTAAGENDAVPVEDDEYGKRYVVDFCSRRASLPGCRSQQLDCQSGRGFSEADELFRSLEANIHECGNQTS